MNKENAGQNSTKQGRQILKQYLQEIGYTDTIIDVRSARLRTLLGLKSANPTSQNNSAINLLSGQQQQNNDQFELIAAANLLVNNQSDPLANLLNGSRQLLQLSNGETSTKRGFNANDVPKLLNLTESDAQSMLMMTNLDFITNQMELGNKGAKNVSNSNGNNDDDDECLNDDEGERSKVITPHQQTNDSETEDALKEFSFLSNELSSGHDDGDDMSSSSSSSDWNVDKAKIIKLTEQYKKDRKSSKNANKPQNQQVLTSHTATSSSQRPNKVALQAMIANLNENSNESGSQQQIKNETSGIKLSPSSNNSTSHQLNNINFSNSTKLFLEEDGLANDSSLGELSRISVNNNNNSSLNISGVNDETIIEVSGF